MPLSPAEKQAAYRARQKQAHQRLGPPPGVTEQEKAFWRAFPARAGDLKPSREALTRLGQTTGSLTDPH